ncbi:hypothetical protein XENORESO_016257 [Xenotaenia resolanae]|uniref:Uncharacterized protein n=1 Tax=Xenotaenia resolanae TaxID=208358 RepID=A0ABV0WYY7_9TELE
MWNIWSDTVAQNIVRPTESAFHKLLEDLILDLYTPTNIKRPVCALMSVWAYQFPVVLVFHFSSKLVMFTTVVTMDLVGNSSKQDLMSSVWETAYFVVLLVILMQFLTESLP